MEKQGKIKIRKYNNEDLATKHCIVRDELLYIAFIESYDGVMLVNPATMPQWLLNKIRENKVFFDDNVIVTVNDNGLTVIENDEAIVDIPKKYSKSLDELFEQRYTKEQVKEMIQLIEPMFLTKYRGGATLNDRKELIQQVFKKLDIL